MPQRRSKIFILTIQFLTILLTTGKKIVHRTAKKNGRNDLAIEMIEHDRSFAAPLQNFSIVSIVKSFLPFFLGQDYYSEIIYREQEGFVNLGSLRLRKIDPPHSPCTKCNGLVRSNRFSFGSLTPNSQNLPARGIEKYWKGDKPDSVFRFAAKRPSFV